jgi:hypothetical protein
MSYILSPLIQSGSSLTEADVAPVVVAAWPLMTRTLELGAEEEVVVEAITTFHNRCMHSYPGLYADKVVALSMDLATRFEGYPFGAYLYTASRLIDLFGASAPDPFRYVTHTIRIWF